MTIIAFTVSYRWKSRGAHWQYRGDSGPRDTPKGYQLFVNMKQLHGAYDSRPLTICSASKQLIRLLWELYTKQESVEMYNVWIKVDT